MSRIELVTPVLETKFHTTEPLRQWCNKGKLDDMFDSLSFLLGCKLFFYFSLFASCHSEVWRVSLQVFESKIDQKRCCFTLLLMKRTSTQQRRFMNTNYPTFSGTDVIITRFLEGDITMKIPISRLRGGSTWIKECNLRFSFYRQLRENTLKKRMRTDFFFLTAIFFTMETSD